MPSINSQIQRPVIPWVLWTVCAYKNTAEDKTAIHLKLYIFIPMTPTPPHWNNANYECPHTWWVGIWFEFMHCTGFNLFFVVLCIIECNISSFLIFHFMLNMPKSFDDDNGVDGTLNLTSLGAHFLHVLVILSLHCALSCLKSCSMIW